MRTRLVLGLAAALGALSGVATAADVELPADFHGIWASPGCAGDGGLLVNFSHGGFRIDGESAHYRGVEKIDPAGDWLRTEKDGAVTFMRLTAPDRLRVAVATVPPEPPAPPKTQKGQQSRPQAAKPRAPLAGPPAERDPPDAWDYTDYARCPRLPSAYAIPHGEAMAVMAGLDQLRGVCGSSGSPDAACAAGLLKLADVSGNGEVSIAELARIGRVAAYFAATMNEEPVGVLEIYGAYAGAIAIAPLLAKAIVASFDYDDSGALSLAELMENREALFEGADRQAFGLAARPKLEGLIEQLKGAEQMLRMLMQ